MDLDSFRSLLASSRTDIFEFINLSIKVASLDHPNELKDRRDHIVQNLFNLTCPTCHPTAEIENFREASPITPQSNQQEPLDPFNGLFDDEEEEEEDEETKILKIRDRLEDPNQSEESLVELLQILADMDITLKALKETDIGRHVNRLRKHPLNEVRVLVKQLVRKWKDMVDEWVKVNTPEEHTASTLNEDGDSPQQPQRKAQNSHHQVPDFAYSPNPYNGNNSEPELKQKVVPRREVTVRPPHSTSASASAPPKLQRQPKDSSIDADRLASARKRLQENYQDAQNARKQRKIQVMDIHEIPKPKNGYIARNKGGPQGRHR